MVQAVVAQRSKVNLSFPCEIGFVSTADVFRFLKTNKQRQPWPSQSETGIYSRCGASPTYSGVNPSFWRPSRKETMFEEYRLPRKSSWSLYDNIVISREAKIFRRSFPPGARARRNRVSRSAGRLSRHPGAGVWYFPVRSLVLFDTKFQSLSRFLLDRCVVRNPFRPLGSFFTS